VIRGTAMASHALQLSEPNGDEYSRWAVGSDDDSHDEGDDDTSADDPEDADQHADDDSPSSTPEHSEHEGNYDDSHDEGDDDTSADDHEDADQHADDDSPSSTPEHSEHEGNDDQPDSQDPGSDHDDILVGPDREVFAEVHAGLRIVKSRREVDVITNFEADTDLIRLPYANDQQGFKVKTVNSARALNRAFRSNADIVYDADSGYLYRNANGREAGLGPSGGFIALLEDGPNRLTRDCFLFEGESY